MIIKTKFLGEVEIGEEHLLFFPEGILGFEESRRFVLLPVPGNEVFQVLQDVENEFVSFIVTSPWKFKEDYDVVIPDEDLLKININHREQIEVLGIVTLSDEFEKSTMNLLAPIVVNAEHLMGRQYVLNQVGYSTKYLLFEKKEEMQHAGS